MRKQSRPHHHPSPAVRLIRQHRAPAPSASGLRFPNPQYSSLSASPHPPLLPSTPPTLPPSHAPSLKPRLRIPARNIPSVASPASSPSCISASLPLRLSLPVSLRSLAVGLDLGRLGGFAGTFFHLCWDPIDALLGCFSAGHFVEHLGCVALTAVELLL